MKNFCFIGHVDSGKSTIAGHLLLNLGHCGEHEFAEIRKKCEAQGESRQCYSRILDIYEQEQERGKTHEFNLIHIGDKYCLIDTPGHKMFIRSMIEGITYFEANSVIGCLVLSAAKGEFRAGWDRGQTKEDIILARSIGIAKLIVLINKMDMVAWDQNIFDEIRAEAAKYIQKCKFAEVHFIPISGYTGAGLTSRDDLPQWYSAKSLIDTIAAIDCKDTQTADEIAAKSWQKMIAQIKLLNVPNIISAGFKCMMHYDGGEYEISIEKIQSAKILRTGDSATVIIESATPVIRGKQTRRFILRDNNVTLGYGNITSAK